MQICNIADLKNKAVLIKPYISHRQLWRNERVYEGYKDTPRPCDAFILTVSGITASYKFDGGTSLNIKKGDLLYIPKGVKYTVSFKGGDGTVDLYTLNFSLFDEAGNGFLLCEKPTVILNSTSPTLVALADNIIETGMDIEKGILALQTEHLTFLNAVRLRVGRGGKQYSTIKNGVELLRQEWNKNEKILRYADVCGISESGFYALFKDYYNMSPLEYRNEIRLLNAKSFLQNSSLSVKEIAFKTGFSDPYYFSRFFKEKTGVSPMKYRKNK